MEQHLKRIEALSAAQRQLLEEKFREWIASAAKNGSEIKSLSAFYTASGELAPEEIKSFLRDRLPEYLLPSEFVRVEALPKTINGKIDRVALESYQAQGTGSGTEPRPSGMDEQQLQMAEIWSRILNVPRVDKNANFFELGGHSLLATQVIMEIEQRFGIEAPLGSIFKYPTVAGLCRYLQTLKPAPAKTVRAATSASGMIHAPMSNAQRRMWYSAQLNESGLEYKLVKVIEATGRMSVATLAQSVTEIVSRQETLRTSFGYVAGELVQKIHPPDTVPIGYVDLSEMPRAAVEAAAGAIQDEILQRPFDLGNGSVIRITLIRISATQARVVIEAHHIVVDGWSISIFVTELNHLFGRFSQGLPSELPALAAQFRDLAIDEKERLTRKDLDSQLAYWRTKLKGTPRLQFPTGGSRAEADGEIEFALAAGDSTQIARVCSQLQITPFMLLVSAYYALLQMHTGCVDAAIGSDVANRESRSYANLIGFFVNQVALRIVAADDIPFRELCQRTRIAVEEAFANKDIPYEVLVRELSHRGNGDRAPLFDAMFSFHHALPEVALDGVRTKFLKVRPPHAKYKLLLNLEEARDGLCGSVEYSGKVFDRATAQRMADDFVALCSEAASCIDSPLFTVQRMAAMKRQESERLRLEKMRAEHQRGFREFLAERAAARSVHSGQ